MQEIQRLENDGKTVVIISEGKKLSGLIAIADVVRESSAEAVKKLGQMGIITYMITGDNRRTAAAIARQAGIRPEHVFAEVLPDRVIVLARVAEKAEDIDIARAEAAKRRAEERLAQVQARAGAGKIDQDLDRARIALMKALVRLNVATRARTRRYSRTSRAWLLPSRAPASGVTRPAPPSRCGWPPSRRSGRGSSA